MVLEAIYEQDFLDGSYDFRPGRSANDALQALWDGLMKMQGGWVLERWTSNEIKQGGGGASRRS